jgi:hypothetical protein
MVLQVASSRYLGTTGSKSEIPLGGCQVNGELQAGTRARLLIHSRRVVGQTKNMVG